MHLATRVLLIWTLLAWPAKSGSGDWLSAAGDAQNTRSQPRETLLKRSTAKQMTLLWRRPLVTSGPLSTPIILGHMATHRGTVELVYVVSETGDVFAIDGDFGTVFWKRSLGAVPGCPGGPVAAPVLTSLPPPDPNVEEDDDAPQPLRPLFLMANGALHTLHPATGQDLAPVRPLLTTGPRVEDLNLQGNRVTLRTGECHGALQPTAIDVGGQAAPENPAGPAATVWPSGEQMLMPVRQGGKLALETALPSFQAMPAATREDADRVRWLYVSDAGQVHAYRVTGTKLQRMWSTPALYFPAPPIVANDVVFVLARGSAQHPAVVYAFHAANGQLLYQSKPEQTKAAAPHSGLALANGHLCFTAADGALYCFGIPMEKE